MGTVLLAALQQLPEQTPGRPVFILAAPSAGILLGALARWWIRQRDEAWLHGKRKKRYEEGLVHYRVILQDPSANRDEKSEARDELANLQKEYGVYIKERARGGDLMPFSAYVEEEQRGAS